MPVRKLTDIRGKRTDTSGNLTANDLSSSSLSVTGRFSQAAVSVSSYTIDCSAGNYFTKSVSSNSTFSVSNVPSSGSYSFTLLVTHTGGSIGWFSGVKWSENTAPTLSTGKKHLFMFVTNDGGSNWYAAALPNYNN